jgi:D-sedoheptulose 7-phosphate isomerase
MTSAAHPAAMSLDGLLHTRAEANARYFEAESQRIAQLCHRMAERFARGGRLLAFGSSPADRSDVRHVAVEFVHPVIVGKRALPALGIEPSGVGLIAEPDDIAIAFGSGDEMASGIAASRAAGCLTLAFDSVGAEYEFPPPTGDPFVAQELAETLYHVLWELVHVFFEHRGLLEGRTGKTQHDSGASSFLYPFLGEDETDLDAVLADVRSSVLAKAAEISALRERTLTENATAIVAAGASLRERLAAGGTLLALGNGGSATDAMDFVADLRHPPPGSGLRPQRALDLVEDPAILTAIANDVGHEAVFVRQIIAHARPGDAVLAISTSGGSTNVLAALEECRRRGVLTVALVGYDGGRILAENLADHVIVARSEHIPRIQEAQATVLHALVELVQR